MAGKPDHEENHQYEGQPNDEGRQKKQSKSEGEGKAPGEGKSEHRPSQRARYGLPRNTRLKSVCPGKIKPKTVSGTDDSLKDYQENLQDRHLDSEKMMRKCGDTSRAQEELRKKKKTDGFHWMQRDVQDPFLQRG